MEKKNKTKENMRIGSEGETGVEVGVKDDLAYFQSRGFTTITLKLFTAREVSESM